MITHKLLNRFLQKNVVEIVAHGPRKKR